MFSCWRFIQTFCSHGCGPAAAIARTGNRSAFHVSKSSLQASRNHGKVHDTKRSYKPNQAKHCQKYVYGCLKKI